MRRYEVIVAQDIAEEDEGGGGGGGCCGMCLFENVVIMLP